MNLIPTTLRDSFSPLRLRNFRIYLSGQALSLIGTWLQVTAQSWVVWELSHSERALGLVGMVATLPILFLSPWAGVWADRLDRRRLLIATQFTAMMLAFILAFLIQTQLIQLWHVYGLSLLLGITTALDFPAQQAFLGDLSGMSEVRKAVNMNAMIIQVSRMLGPAAAGFIIAQFGTATAFWLNGISFAAVIVSLALVTTTQPKRAISPGGPFSELVEAARFIRSQPRIQDLIFFVVLITFFGLPIINILSSVADEVLRSGAETLGYLMAASGAGALIGVVFVVPYAQLLQRAGVVVAIAVLWLGSWFVAFSFSTITVLSVITLFFGSIAAPTVFTMALGLIQLIAPPDMRARLLSFFVTVSFGFQPFASLLIGFSADSLGTLNAIRINGFLLITGAILMLVFRSGLIQWEIKFGQQIP